MIELTQGRSVRWQHDGAWFTGYVLNDEYGPAEHMTHLSDGAYFLVRHSNTHKVFIVKASELQDNDFRTLEIEMERIIDALEKAYRHADEQAKGFIPYEGAKDLLKRFQSGTATVDEVKEFIEEAKES